MKVVTSYPSGLFSWIDLSTPAVAEAKAFYTALFGWDAEDIPVPGAPPYTMFRIEGYSVAGAGPLPPGSEGHHAYWSSYINHEDVDAVAARVAAAGGTVTRPPMDVMEEGRMAIIQDPTGAVVGLWQPKNHIGAQLVNQDNTLIWNELQTRESERAIPFYQALFDWTSRRDENGYVTFAADGRVQAGLMETDDSWGEIPSHWAVYFKVAAVQDLAIRAEALGGTMIVPPSRAGQMGTFAVLQDPQGASFTVMEFDGEVDDPPGT
ncbi:MAG: VOC family protein [Anaerolineales bacterium]|nr:VOC family protein [Anaerolineales bacterium]MCB9127837.1 VOC family protein [Ardenticatenales bacterium]MCB9172904.1 VOC family protein [Ardenticatenales bacterium]